MSVLCPEMGPKAQNVFTFQAATRGCEVMR
ncbi:MAG: hypothetical protein GAK30_02663 [Paracidovorax wautersii]|uniref:Uncharacterized protein n=1 Tax=Paracidovorax wautersii TaxID=1177982 RepID=A0A7V8FMH6_9BURK|nr:MAG: hypothetical protein GAK30_02663 [Paracidovorax wautersii]